MISVTIEKAAHSLPELIHDTLVNCEETVIVSDTGTVVMIDQAEWENIKETLNLLLDKKSLKALLDGHQKRDQGEIPEESLEDYCLNKAMDEGKKTPLMNRNEALKYLEE